MATGEKSGTWGTITNTNLGTILEKAIAGRAAVTHDDTASYSLTTANGSDDEARCAILNIGGALTAARNVVCPTSAKPYIIKNATTGGFAITLKTSAGTGIEVPNGKTLFLFCDGTNVVNAIDYFASITLLDNAFTLQDNSDTTKQLQFQLSGITTATTRTLTVPDASGTLFLSGSTDLAVADGGTGASTAADARTNLGLVIGTNVQAYDAELAAIAGLTSAADKGIMFTGSGTAAVYTLTAAGLALLDDAAASNQRTTLGLGTAAVLAETTTAEFMANTADRALSTDQVWAAGAEVSLTDAATVAVDMSLGLNFVLNTIGGNRTLGAPSNTKVGQSGFIRIIQDGTGSRTLAYHANWKFAGGTDPVLTTTAGATDILFYQVVTSTFIYASLVKAVA
jgi:hypothetical protein